MTDHILKLNLTNAFSEVVVALVDGPTPALDASQGNVFTLDATGDSTIAIPTNPIDGQKILIRHFAVAGARTLSLNEGSGGFRFGTSITELTETIAGTADYIGCIYNLTDNSWDVISYAKGFTAPPYSTELVAASNQFWSISDANQTGLGFEGAFTFSAWIKLNSTVSVSNNILISKWSTDSNRSSYVWYLGSSGEDQKIALAYIDSGDAGHESSVSWSLSTDTWYHVAITYTASGTDDIKFFVNGVQQGSTQSSGGTDIRSGTAAFEVGADQSEENGPFDGLMDDVRVWSRVLSDGDISDLYSTPCTFDNGADLEGWWLFDHSGNDSSSNNNNLANNNSATFSLDVPYTCS